MAMQKSTKVVIWSISGLLLIAIVIIIIVMRKASTQVSSNRAVYVPPAAGNPKGGTDFGPLLNTAAQTLLDWWKKKNGEYVQVAPINSYGCDALGNDERGIPCTTNSGYTQVEPIDENGCDANGYNVIGTKCL